MEEWTETEVEENVEEKEEEEEGYLGFHNIYYEQSLTFLCVLFVPYES